MRIEHVGNESFYSPATGTVSITSAVTTANVALGPGTFDQLRVYNADAANISFVNWGNSTVTASLPSGSTRGHLQQSGTRQGNSIVPVAPVG
jgi:hypothetical protein